MGHTQDLQDPFFAIRNDIGLIVRILRDEEELPVFSIRERTDVCTGRANGYRRQNTERYLRIKCDFNWPNNSAMEELSCNLLVRLASTIINVG